MAWKNMAVAVAAWLGIAAGAHFAWAGENLRLVLNERPDVPTGGLSSGQASKNLLLTDEDEGDTVLARYYGGRYWGGNGRYWGGWYRPYAGFYRPYSYASWRP